jgi:hypothetical protein
LWILIDGVVQIQKPVTENKARSAFNQKRNGYYTAKTTT